MSRRVLITGAASGIGAAAAERMRSKGAKVVGLDLNGHDAKDILACDLSDPEAVARMVPEAIERLGLLERPLHELAPPTRAVFEPRAEQTLVYRRAAERQRRLYDRLVAARASHREGRA